MCNSLFRLLEKTISIQGRREKFEAPGQKREVRTPAGEASRTFLAFFREPLDVEALGAMRPLGP